MRARQAGDRLGSTRISRVELLKAVEDLVRTSAHFVNGESERAELTEIQTRLETEALSPKQLSWINLRCAELYRSLCRQDDSRRVDSPPDTVERSGVRRMLFAFTPEPQKRGVVGRSQLVLTKAATKEKVALELGLTTEPEIEELRRELVSMSKPQLDDAFAALTRLEEQAGLSGENYGEDGIAKIGIPHGLATVLRGAVAVWAVAGGLAAGGLDPAGALDLHAWHTPQGLYAIPLALLTVLDGLRLSQNIRAGGSAGRCLEGLLRLLSSVLSLCGNLPLGGFALAASAAFHSVRQEREPGEKDLAWFRTFDRAAFLGPKLKAFIEARSKELE